MPVTNRQIDDLRDGEYFSGRLILCNCLDDLEHENALECKTSNGFRIRLLIDPPAAQTFAEQLCFLHAYSTPEIEVFFTFLKVVELADIGNFKNSDFDVDLVFLHNSNIYDLEDCAITAEEVTHHVNEAVVSFALLVPRQFSTTYGAVATHLRVKQIQNDAFLKTKLVDGHCRHIEVYIRQTPENLDRIQGVDIGDELVVTGEVSIYRGRTQLFVNWADQVRISGLKLLPPDAVHQRTFDVGRQ